MKYDKYPIVDKDSFRRFEFKSIGPKGSVLKCVRFAAVNVGRIYALEFGDINKDGEIDFKRITDNNDRDKVLATVALIISIFFHAYPRCAIYITGSTKSRTRLYRMAISKNLEELQRNFQIDYVIGQTYGPFERDMDCDGYMVTKIML